MICLNKGLILSCFFRDLDPLTCPFMMFIYVDKSQSVSFFQEQQQ